MFELSIFADDILAFGIDGQPTRAAAEKHLPQMRDYVTKCGAHNYDEILLIKHHADCPGCPDMFGLDDGCEVIATYPVA